MFPDEALLQWNIPVPHKVLGLHQRPWPPEGPIFLLPERIYTPKFSQGLEYVTAHIAAQHLIIQDIFSHYSLGCGVLVTGLSRYF